MSDVRILLGVASGGTPAAPFIEALGKLKLPKNCEPLQRSVVMGNFVPAQREFIMRDAIEGKYDYLFFVDDDIVLPENALEMLLETAESDPQTAVVGGLYYSRDSLRPIAVNDWDSSDTSTAHVPAFSSRSKNPVAGIGFGCALLRVATAEKLSAPYFPAHVFIERENRRARLCDEDYLYCERVRKAGFIVRLDGRVRCLHYDRAGDSMAPAAWENDSATSQERMVVQTKEGTAMLVPFDDQVPRIAESHQRADVTYITVG